MFFRPALLAAALAAATGSADAAPRPARATPPPAAKPAPPAPVKPGPPGPSDWRTPDPQDILVIDTNKGRVIVELIPEIAPNHVQRIRDLAHENFYDRLTFFRVIENFMDQTGDPQNTGVGGSAKPNLAAEFTFRRGPDTGMVLASDQGVAETGFIKSMPVMSQSSMLMPMTADGKVSAWGLYCPGVAAMARDNDPASGNSQFFLMRAGYPSLERRYTAWGRVLAGQDVVRAIKTGEPVAEPQDRMEKVRLLSDMPAAERPQVRVVDPRSAWFKSEIEWVRMAKSADFTPCDVEIPVEVK
ncbi:peptidylprolyl isomerase [Phenylobacterium sp.]|jgi:peptidylprolyl isomerase|uniref:peptidylprolyl isomerase n=1 Tax=Phenylobacterium sp. TaxID=1871053 RepID=UPI002F41B61E